MAMKYLLRYLAFVLMSGSGIAQSNLPTCQGLSTTYWNNCFGTYTYSDGSKYLGEWRNGKRNGQGTYFLSSYFPDSSYVGEWNDDKFNGQGTYTVNGTVRSQGIWDSGNFVRSSSPPLSPNIPKVDSSSVLQNLTTPMPLESRRGISIDEAKTKCAEIGFKNATEAFGKCVLQLTK
jgi:hypothetical protein